MCVHKHLYKKKEIKSTKMLTVRKMKFAKKYKKKHNVLEKYIHPAIAAFINYTLSTQFKCKPPPTSKHST